MFLIQRIHPIDLTIDCESHARSLFLDELVNRFRSIGGAVELGDQPLRWRFGHFPEFTR